MKPMRFLAAASCVALAVLSLSARAETETIVVTAEMSPYYMGGTGGDAKNKANKVYDLQPGATLCVSNLSSVWRIWTNIVSTNGLAFISAYEQNPGLLDLRGSLIASGEGRLGIKGFGNFLVSVDTTLGAYVGDAYLDAPNLFFADADGNPRSGTLTIEKGMIKAIPTAAGVNIAWATGAQIALPAGNPWCEADPFVFPSDKTMEVYLAEPGAVKAGATVSVAAGCAFGLCAGARTGENNPFTYGYRTTGALTNDSHVVLAKGAAFVCASRAADVCTGVIEGEGEVSVHSFKDRGGSTYVTTKLLGENKYTGATRIANDYQRLYFGASVPSGLLASTGLYSEFRFLPAEAEEGGNSKVTVSEFDAPYLACKICAASNQTVTVKRVVGKGWGAVDVADGSAVVDFNPAVGPAVIRVQNQYLHVLFNGTTYDKTGVAQLFKDNSNELLLLLSGPNGEDTPWTEGSGLRVDRPWLTVGGDHTYTTVPPYAPIRVMGESTVRIASDANGIGAIVGPEATVKVEYTGCWSNTAALWLDPDRSKVYRPGELVKQEWIDIVGSAPSLSKTGSTGDYIEGMMDCRGEETHGEYMGFNDRVYDYVVSEHRYENIAYMTHAMLATRKDGRKYIDCHTIGSARLPLHKGGKDTIKVNSEAAFAANMVIMVIDSEYGGGNAIVGTSDAAYKRAVSATGPITSKAVKGDIWLDGKKVADPTVTCLNGGWQVVSVDVSAYKIDGFGWSNRRSNNGKAAYGDILIFTNKVSTAERQAAEKYLADKWGIATYAAEAPEVVQIQVSGSGTAEISGGTPLRISGGFSGTAKLAAGTEVVIPSALPWGEEEVAATSPRGWYDPSVRSQIVTKADSGMGQSQADEVCALWDRRGGYKTKSAGMHYLYGIGERTPTYVEYQRGTGPFLGWIDYNNLYEASLRPESTGNTLRMRYWNESYTDKTALGEGGDKAFTAKTVFIVQDSCRGGSTPVHDTVGGGSSIPRRTGVSTSPIFHSSTAADIKGGDVRLNGKTVAAPTGTGFTGEPEVFSFATQNDMAFSAGFFAAYQETESSDKDVEKRVAWLRANQAGAIQGEILLYDKYLTADERANVETYLMGKWIGYLPNGKTDWRKATVDGEGRATVATLAAAPTLAPTFAGTLNLTGDEAAPTREVTVNAATGEVAGGWDAPDATVTHRWTGSPVLNVTVTGNGYGEFALIDLKAISPAVTWTVNVTSARGYADVVQSADGRCVTLKIVPKGSMILVR